MRLTSAEFNALYRDPPNPEKPHFYKRAGWWRFTMLTDAFIAAGGPPEKCWEHQNYLNREMPR